MEYRILKRENALYHHCAEVIHYTLEYPEFDGCDELSSFFARFADEYETFLRGKLYESVCSDEKRGDEKEKRGRRRMKRALRVSMKASVGFGMDCVSVVFRISVGEKTLLRTFTFDEEKSTAVKLTDLISNHEAKKFGEMFYIVNNTIYAIDKNGKKHEIISEKYQKRQKTQIVHNY